MRQALTLTDTQYRQVIAFCNTRKHTQRDQTIIHVSFLAGLRAMEIAGLSISDVYDHTGAVRDQFNITGTQTKGGHTRAVYVSRKLKRVLQQFYPLLQHRSPTDPLFQTQIRTRFSANTMCQLFLQIYKDCGLKGASSHSGRRTFITKLANTGINVRLLAALAGHQHISTTQRYIDVNDAQLAQAVELI